MFINFFVKGVRRKGIETTEEMLREGTYVTGIGELSTEVNEGSFKLQVPANGSPFYLTVLPISSLIKKLEDQRRIYRFVKFSISDYTRTFLVKEKCIFSPKYLVLELINYIK